MPHTRPNALFSMTSDLDVVTLNASASQAFDGETIVLYEWWKDAAGAYAGLSGVTGLAFNPATAPDATGVEAVFDVSDQHEVLGFENNLTFYITLRVTDSLGAVNGFYSFSEGRGLLTVLQTVVGVDYYGALLIDRFGGEMIAYNTGVSGYPLRLSYSSSTTGSPFAQTIRESIAGVRYPSLYRPDGLRGSLSGLCVQETASLQWFVYESKDFGQTWERLRMAWDENYYFVDMSGTYDGLEITVAVQRVTLNLYFKYYSPDGWSTPVLIKTAAGKYKPSIRQKVEVGGTEIVVYHNLHRYISKNLGASWANVNL